MNCVKYLLFSLFVLSQGLDSNNLKLKQLFILSRHNIRAPLFYSELQKFSPKFWPKFDGEPGHLTRKGFLMEGYMGNYFAEWFTSENLLIQDCSNEVYVYANSVNRTIATAKSFIETAFKGCNVHVNYKHTETGGEIDPMFAPILHNKTETFKDIVFNEILEKQNNSKLIQSLSLMNEILNIKNAEICKTDSICDLTDISKSDIYFEIGKELLVHGPLYAAISVLDFFSMNYYEGTPLEDIAWGFAKSPDTWKVLTEIGRQDQNIRYTTTSKDFGRPMLNYLAKTFINWEEMPKIVLLFGHDYNQNAILHCMDFKQIPLPNHYDSYPIGGKIVFQRWTDDENDYLKIEYVYGSSSQIRNGTILSLVNPPQRLILELNWCNVDENGFCSWEEFVNELPMVLDL